MHGVNNLKSEKIQQLYLVLRIKTYFYRIKICNTGYNSNNLEEKSVYNVFKNIHIHRGKRLQRCQQGRPSPFVPINVHSYPKLYMHTLPSPYFLCFGVYRFCVLFLLTPCHSIYLDHDNDKLKLSFTINLF